MHTVFRELNRDAVFCFNYARAKEAQADHMAMELLEIADDGRNDWMTRERQQNGQTITELVPDQEHIQRSRLRVDTRKWLMARMNPKKYGEQSITTIQGADGGPVRVEQSVTLPALEAFAVKLKAVTAPTAQPALPAPEEPADAPTVQ